MTKSFFDRRVEKRSLSGAKTRLFKEVYRKMANSDGQFIFLSFLGQGIAGTMLAYFFEKRGISFKIVDAVDYHLTQIKQELVNDNFKHPSHGASNVSTGIINPVTGRRFVKSWMIDTLNLNF